MRSRKNWPRRSRTQAEAKTGRAARPPRSRSTRPFPSRVAKKPIPEQSKYSAKRQHPAGQQLPTRLKRQSRPVDCVWFLPDATHRKRPTVGPVSGLSQERTLRETLLRGGAPLSPMTPESARFEDYGTPFLTQLGVCPIPVAWDGPVGTVQIRAGNGPDCQRILIHRWKPSHSAVGRRNEKSQLATAVNSAQFCRNGLWNAFLLP